MRASVALFLAVIPAAAAAAPAGDSPEARDHWSAYTLELMASPRGPVLYGRQGGRHWPVQVPTRDALNLVGGVELAGAYDRRVAGGKALVGLAIGTAMLSVPLFALGGLGPGWIGFGTAIALAGGGVSRQGSAEHLRTWVGTDELNAYASFHNSDVYRFVPGSESVASPSSAGRRAANGTRVGNVFVGVGTTVVLLGTVRLLASAATGGRPPLGRL